MATTLPIDDWVQAMAVATAINAEERHALARTLPSVHPQTARDHEAPPAPSLVKLSRIREALALATTLYDEAVARYATPAAE